MVTTALILTTTLISQQKERQSI